MLRLLFVLFALAALAAAFTNPGPEAAEAEMRSQFLDAVAGERLTGKSGAEAALLLGCRLDPNACFDLIRSGVDLKIEDRVVYARLDLEGFGQAATCYGAFLRFFCPGGLQPD